MSFSSFYKEQRYLRTKIWEVIPYHRKLDTVIPLATAIT